MFFFNFTNGQLKTRKTGTQLYTEPSRVSIPWLGCSKKQIVSHAIYQFSGVHKLIDSLNGDLTLNKEDDEHGEDVERDSQEVEKRQRDEGRVGVQHVGRVGQHVSREGGLKFYNRTTIKDSC